MQTGIPRAYLTFCVNVNIETISDKKIGDIIQEFSSGYITQAALFMSFTCPYVGYMSVCRLCRMNETASGISA